MVTGLTALFVWLKSRNTERAPAPAAMVVSPESGMARPIVLVDVRTPEEYRTGHKEGALNIPADEVEQRAAQLLPDKNAVILLYCRTGLKCSFRPGWAERRFREAPAMPPSGSDGGVF